MNYSFLLYGQEKKTSVFHPDPVFMVLLFLWFVVKNLKPDKR